MRVLSWKEVVDLGLMVHIRAPAATAELSVAAMVAESGWY